jgi:shikimate kinase / 3-dehydroquinate synthase
VALVGLPGSGKTAAGACLAERLGRPFVDLDLLVEQRTGRSPAEWLETFPESAFRAVESEALADALRTDGIVLATGGGSVVDPLNRWALAEAATTVWLDAPDRQLMDRLERSSVPRPLLHARGAGGAAGALARLREAREPFYRAADIHVDASASVHAVTEAVVRAIETVDRRDLGRRLFDAVVARHHAQGPETARIVLGRNLARRDYAGILAAVSTGEPLVVLDDRAARALPGLAAALPGERRIRIRAGERAKRLRSVERLLESAADLGLERSDAWIAVGGGTTGDLVATAAALYQRGAPLVHVPTTWLAQADASIGGKAAVDLSRAKNAAGAFWPPLAVITDVTALRTLPGARLLDGLAEALKCALIGDPGLWALIEQRGRPAAATRRPDEAARYAITELAVRLKLGVVGRDPYELGERRTLNLGHTLGHALEVESGYRLAHGQAVMLGLRAVATIAAGRGADRGLADRIDTLAARLGFPARRSFDPAAVTAALASDKKRLAGRQRWILPMSVGRVIEVDDITSDELHRGLGAILAPADAVSRAAPARPPAPAARPA